jgi:hypothetical protein
MGQIAAAPEQDEDRAYEDARQRALDKFTFDRPEVEDRLDPARGIIFGTLAGAALIIWAGFWLWRYLP